MGDMALLLTSLALAVVAQASDFNEPFKVLDGTQPINVEIGHAAPLLYDINGDGKKELLVGQFGGGKLRIYKNVGTNSNPQFEGFTWFQAGGQLASIPSG